MPSEQSEMDALSQLKKMVIGQKAVTLPDISEEHDLWSLHQQMQAYDRFVTERVIRVLGGEKIGGGYPEVEQLHAALEDAPEEANSALLAQYRRYQQRLDEMLALANQAVEAAG